MKCSRDASWLSISILGYQKEDNSNDASLKAEGQEHGHPGELLPKDDHMWIKSRFEVFVGTLQSKSCSIAMNIP